MATTTYYPNSSGAPTIADRTGGTAAKATSGDVTPALPASWAADDIHVCLIAAKDNVECTMPAGWTLGEATNNGANFRTTWFWRRAVAGDANPLVTHTGGGYIVAVIGGGRGCVTTDSPIDVAGAWKANASSATVAADAVTPTVPDVRLMFLGGTATQATFSTYTGTPTPVERADVPNTANYPSACIAQARFTPPGTTGARQCTASAAAVNNAVLIALKDSQGGAAWVGSDNQLLDAGATLAFDTSSGYAAVTSLNTISVDDENFLSYTPGTAFYPVQGVRFKIAEEVATITQLTPTFKGYNFAEAPADRFYDLLVWNFTTSVWVLLDSHSEVSKDTVTGDMSVDPDHYVLEVGTDKFVYIGLGGGQDAGYTGAIYTYYGQLVVTYTPTISMADQIISCG